MYRIFTLESPGFTAMLLKMTYTENEEKLSNFSLKQDKAHQVLYSPDYILHDFFDIFFCMATSKMSDIKIISSAPEKRKIAGNIIKKLRVSTTFNPFDSITFTKDFMDRVDDLIESFDAISDNQLFFMPIKDGLSNNSFKQLPVWFNTFNLNSIADWVVAHFEVRILSL